MLDELDRSGAAAIDVRAEALEAFRDEMDAGMEGTVWQTGGCASWYQDETGRVTTLWPDYTFTYRKLMSDFDRSDYEFVPVRRAEPEPVPA
jgi:hypothetical protein